MKQNLKKINFLTLAFLLLGACATAEDPETATDNQIPSSTQVEQQEVDDNLPQNFSRFTDIPIPARSMMDLRKTLLFGGDDDWIGRLFFSAPYNVGGMYDFYVEEMPRYGWKRLTTVRSERNTLTYRRAGRVANIQFEPSSTNGTDVYFVVSPEGMEKRF